MFLPFDRINPPQTAFFAGDPGPLAFAPRRRALQELQASGFQPHERQFFYLQLKFTPKIWRDSKLKPATFFH
jgi:hypothetical protein